MSDKRLYLLAVFDGETQRRMAGYYDVLTVQGLVGQQTKGIPYHFTLGDTETEREAAVIMQAEEIAARFEPIEFRMDHIGLFGLNVLFLEPAMNFELMRLQNNFFSDCGYGQRSWAAHGTILIGEPEAILRAVPLLAEHFEPFSARIESVAVYECFPVRFVKQVGLGAMKPCKESSDD
ncbi:MAG: 2'-5' RNA ligase family protein [Oscillospiraceae bacterium]|jgi:2'-5' RNA ligase|nr:2'-5' RNA ligase family protein [Oscillospiraceae bacterium]